MELRLLKGTADYLPESQIVRETILRKLIDIFELYGFNPLETPILEFYDILASKYAGGSEILKETYKITDQGDRDLCLRYDLTVPLSRVMGMNPHLKMPFKRYEIGKVFRDGPVTTIRSREFTQCDIDTVGTTNQLAEAEIVEMAFKALSELGIDVVIEVNNRKLLSGIISFAGIGEDLISSAILSVDKFKKIGIEGVKKELIDKGIDDPAILSKLFDVLKITGKDWADTIDKVEKTVTINESAKTGIAELREFFSYLEAMGISDRCILLLSLARGLEIYTGTVFEVYTADGSFKASLAAGGRYDKIIGGFLGNDSEVPAVGISFGLESIHGVLMSKKSSSKQTVTELLIVPLKVVDLTQIFSITKDLRNEGIFVEIELMDIKIKKSLDRANKLGIEYVSVIGPKEIDSGKINLKIMKTGEQSLISLEAVVQIIKTNRFSDTTDYINIVNRSGQHD